MESSRKLLLEMTERHTVKVFFGDGNYIVSTINGTEEEIGNYYLRSHFNFGDTEGKPRDDMHRAVCVLYLD